MEIQFVNLKKDVFLAHPLFKIIPNEFIYNTLGKENRYLWFANPAEWEDPLEKQFVSMKYRSRLNNTVAEYPFSGRIFCSCFSIDRVSEGQWKAFSSGGKSCVRLTINKLVLLEELQKFCERNNAKAFVGKVCYQDTRTLDGSLMSNPFLNEKNPFSLSNEEDSIRLLLLKRNAFKHESELRIIVVMPQVDTQNKAGLKVLYECEANELVEQIMLGPKISKEEIRSDAHNENIDWKNLGFDDTIDKLGRQYKRVISSQLFDKKIKTFKYID